MTFGIANVVGCIAVKNGSTETKKRGFFGTKEPLFGKNWKEVRLCRALFEGGYWTLDDIYQHVIGAHASHLLDFLVALSCYLLLYADGKWEQEAQQFQVGWVSRIILYNLVVELCLATFWHYMTYVSDVHDKLVAAGRKYNNDEQYEPSSKAYLWSSSSCHLEREIFFSTLGWLQSAGWQVVFTHLWAIGAMPVYTNFFAQPVRSFGLLILNAYWREIHFYFAHRNMHPWWNSENGLLDGDIGAFLYRHVHSLHHKSYNPGPWSGLSMHPVEHFLYYTCATLPALFIRIHPLHFLYTKFHADIAPLGGHDGMAEPGGASEYHYLHHSKFECNYGVPFPINLDKIFGTWVELNPSEEASDVIVQADSKAAPLLEASTAPLLTMEEVSKHHCSESCWIILYGQVLDVSTFLKQHPGGEKVILAMAGKDATVTFEKIHNKSGGWALVAKWVPDALVGKVRDWSGPLPPTVSTSLGRWPGPPLLFGLLLALSFTSVLGS